MATAILLDSQPPTTVVVQEERARIAAEANAGSIREYTDLAGNKISVNLSKVLTLQDYVWDPDAEPPEPMDAGPGPMPYS
jgi:hypothetical protein